MTDDAGSKFSMGSSDEFYQRFQDIDLERKIDRHLDGEFTGIHCHVRTRESDNKTVIRLYNFMTWSGKREYISLFEVEEDAEFEEVFENLLACAKTYNLFKKESFLNG
jgi:hypothetical protein